MGEADVIGFAILRLNEEAANNEGCGACLSSCQIKLG